jgi:two-component system sensor histidine kinase KdpD
MGLAIARGIVDAHHGRIWVEDAEDGHGAKFVIELPIKSEPPAVVGGSNVRDDGGKPTQAGQ